MRKLKLTFIIMIVSMLFIGCSTQSGEDETFIYDDITKVYREVNIENKEQMFNDLTDAIKGINKNIIYIADRDIVTDAIVNNHYYFNNAIYIQMDTYMYRFQLKDSKVESYIKYNLEA